MNVNQLEIDEIIKVADHPQVFTDGHILDFYPDEFPNGIRERKIPTLQKTLTACSQCDQLLRKPTEGDIVKTTFWSEKNRGRLLDRLVVKLDDVWLQWQFYAYFLSKGADQYFYSNSNMTVVVKRQGEIIGAIQRIQPNGDT